ncbi:hypothetical protein [Sorangium atrum]|uniref:Alkaline phosphatase n=1 Tax=Sorangium atrum TaxID=2995308 RepID=A0ABT5C4W4_9BACT|nr:hypothetical protein [Sorangium aterium]MDC0681450.1 hypothetical protein [Sorangium aterium]
MVARDGGTADAAAYRMGPYSIDLRQRIIDAYQNREGSIRELAERFEVAPNTVQNYLTQLRATGDLGTAASPSSWPIASCTTRAASASGHAGDETIEGGGVNDIISGGAGNDRLFGNGGDDQLFGDGGDDYLDGVAGTDTLDGDRLTSGADSDVCLVEAADSAANCEL